MTTPDSLPARSVRVTRVQRVRHGDSTRMVRPADFDTEFVEQHASLAGLLDYERYVPLCVDWRATRLVYGRWDAGPAMTDVPFLYQHQRRHVQMQAEVPFEQLDGRKAIEQMTPTFLFSIGRCGSTLLSRLLAAAGEQAISEPDVLTSVAHFDDENERAAAEGWRRTVVQACVAAFAPSCGRAPVIKLRARCNLAVDVFLEAAPHALYVFMCRDRNEWARSNLRAFGESGAALADLLKASLEAFARMHRAGVRPVLVWYEDLLADPVGALDRIVPASAGRLETRRGAIAAAFGKDAQEGSGLSRAVLSSRTGDAVELAAFDARWRAIRPEALLDEYGFARLR